MSVPRTAADVLRNHVTLELECLDRLYLNVYQPRLQYDCGVVNFFRYHRQQPFASSALMKPISDAFIENVDQFVKRRGVPVITFRKGERKEDIVLPFRQAARGRERLLVVGKAQEKTPVFRTEQRSNPETGAVYPWIVKSTAMVNHYYFYCLDDDFGPFFLKVCTYFPYNSKLCLNGHEYLKRQLTKEKIPFEELDVLIQQVAFYRARIRSGCGRSLRACRPKRSRPYWRSGSGSCRNHSPLTIKRRGIGMTCRFCNVSAR